MPIIIDPTLVRAAKKADIELLNEGKKKGNDVRFLIKNVLWAGGQLQRTTTNLSPIVAARRCEHGKFTKTRYKVKLLNHFPASSMGTSCNKINVSYSVQPITAQLSLTY